MLTIATSKFHHLRHPFACRLRAAGGRRLSRGSGGAGRPCRALDVAALRERRCRPAAQARQAGSAPGRTTHRAASRERLTRTAAAVDNGSHRGPTVTWRTWFCGAKSLIFGAAGRIRTHDPLVRGKEQSPLTGRSGPALLPPHARWRRVAHRCVYSKVTTAQAPADAAFAGPSDVASCPLRGGVVWRIEQPTRCGSRAPPR